jgi:hypothetical protein
VKFLCLAYGDERGWNALTKAEQDELLAQDEVMRRRGDLVSAVSPELTTVRAWDGTPTTSPEPQAQSTLPLAGFGIIEAADLDEAIRLVADTPCARAKGAVELREMTMHNDAGRPHAESPASDAVRVLDVFAGRWHAEGTSYGRGNSEPWMSDERYEWILGGAFLLHRWDAGPFIGSEILGFDKDGGYFSRMFDNSGNHPEYHISVEGNVWRFEEPETRAAVTVRENGRVMDWKWEWKDGGTEWKPLCDRTARRVD